MTPLPAAEAAARAQERGALAALWSAAAEPAEAWAAAYLFKRFGCPDLGRL